MHSKVIIWVYKKLIMKKGGDMKFIIGSKYTRLQGWLIMVLHGLGLRVEVGGHLYEFSMTLYSDDNG